MFELFFGLFYSRNSIYKLKARNFTDIQRQVSISKFFLSILHLKARNFTDIKGHVSFSRPKFSIPYLKARNYDDIRRHARKLVFYRVSSVFKNLETSKKTRSKQEEEVTLLQRRMEKEVTLLQRRREEEAINPAAK